RRASASSSTNPSASISSWTPSKAPTPPPPPPPRTSPRRCKRSEPRIECRGPRSGERRGMEMGVLASALGLPSSTLGPLSSIRRRPSSLLLWAGACAGHAAVLVFGLNWMYAFPLPRLLLKAARRVDFLLILASPLLFWFACGLHHGAGVEVDFSSPGGAAVGGYVVLCWVLGLGVVPVITLARLLRKRPAALLGDHTHTLDVAGEL